jgi:hypothetical protein
MKHALTQDCKLNQLGNILDYWRWKYEVSHPFFKAEYYLKYQEARQKFGEYYKITYPNTIPTQESKDYVRLADMTENFEEYGNY